MVAYRNFHEPRRLRACEPVLGLALEMRVADEQGEHQLRPVHHIVRVDVLRPFLPHQLAKCSNAAGERGPETLGMGAAVRSGNGIAII